MPGPTDRSKMQSKAGKATTAELEALQAKIAELEAQVRAQGPEMEQAKADVAAKRQGDTYARQVDEDDAAASLEADTKALEKKRPVAVQKTLDRDSIDYPGDKPAAARVKTGSGEGGFVFGGPQYGAEAVRASAGPQAAVAGNTGASGTGASASDLEARLAAARERLRAKYGTDMEVGSGSGGRAGR